MAIAFQIINHKHLQSNPAPIIAAHSFASCYYGFMGVSRKFICNGNLEGIAAATMYYDMSESSQLKVMYNIQQLFTFMCFFIDNFITDTNIFLHIDLILTIK